jgi:hypothetical protein
LTYGRILAVPAIVGCYMLDSFFGRWLALLIFIAASVTDFLDGYLARLWHQQSAIGRMLDPIADKLLVAVSLMLLVSDNAVGDWSLLAAIIILMREISVSGLREFLADTLWGGLAFLFLDLPPGSDRMSNVIGLLPEGTGTLIVTLPSEVSQLVVKKSITMTRDVLRAPVVGLLENMGAYVCEGCGASEPLFHDGGSERMAREMGIAFLGRVPFDPRISACGDRGVPFVLEHGDSPAAKAFADVATRLEEYLRERTSRQSAEAVG